MDKFDSNTGNNLNEPKIFQEIKQQLNQAFPSYSNTKINYINSLDNNELMIKINLKKITLYDSLVKDIHFSIVTDLYFPESIPSLKCLTNFTHPTIFDGRNLLFSVIHHNWTKECTIVDIVKKLPEFISRVMENYNNKILVYYGDYQIDKVYDMNELILNKEINFYKIEQRLRKNKKTFSKQRYIILTDIYFLLFDPILEKRNNGRLLFWGDIRQIISSKNTEISSEYLFLEWKNEEDKVVVNFEIEFNEKSLISDFLKNSNLKISKLKENFKIFQDDISKPTSEEYQNLSLEKLQLLIKYKENLLQKKYSVNLVKELMNLYQKIIEMLSASNDESFTLYLEKLHKMLQMENSSDSLGNQHTDQPFTGRNTFRLSSNAFSSLNDTQENGNN